MSDGGKHVVLPAEAEAFVESLRTFKLEEVGSLQWIRQHEYLEKLNIQAVLNATAQEDEFVKSFLVSYEKVSVLIYDLLLTEIWKENIFTELINMDFEPKTTFPIYMVLYHEASVVNLLETTLFYQEACESASDSILDLLDYCYRKLTDLVARKDDYFNEKDEVTSTTKTSTMEELEHQESLLEFGICIKTISLLRYITDHLEVLPLCVMSRMLNTHDIPILLVHLVENPPWTRQKNEKIYKYFDSKWNEISHDDTKKLTKTEGQVLIALFHLLMDTSCQKKYDLNTYRKNVILKLRSFITEILLDQMPILIEMQRYLQHLSMMDPPTAKRDLILEQVPEIRKSILKENAGKWGKIAENQSKTHFNPSEEAMHQMAKRWVDTYSIDAVEELISNPPKCALCGTAATKRCSGCQNEWYCCRECQVNHWPKHKKSCDLLFESIKKSS